MLLPYIIEEQELVDVDTLAYRVGELNLKNNLSYKLLDVCNIKKIILELARDRPEVFEVIESLTQDIGKIRISVRNADNLVMLRLYPKQGLYYNLHYLGEGKSPITESLIRAMRQESNRIYQIIKKVEFPKRISSQMIFAIACGIANPEWFFGDGVRQNILEINNKMASEGYQLVESNGLWLLVAIEK